VWRGTQRECAYCRAPKLAKYHKVDTESGDELESADIIKGYEVGKGEYIELDPEELDAVAIESKRVAAPFCEVLSPCRGRRPYHVQKDRIGTWEISSLTHWPCTSTVRAGKVTSQRRRCTEVRSQTEP
jgi:hypothetical protein